MVGGPGETGRGLSGLARGLDTTLPPESFHGVIVSFRVISINNTCPPCLQSSQEQDLQGTSHLGHMGSTQSSGGRTRSGTV